MSAPPLWATGVCEGLFAAGCRHVVYVPDNPLSHVLHVLRTRFSEIQTVVATREEEAFGIAAGLYLGGVRPAVLLQSSGLGNSLNAVTSLLLPYQIPVMTVISMRGDAGEWNAAQTPMGRAVGAILDAVGVPYVSVDVPDTASAVVKRTAMTAFGTRQMAACLLPRAITVPAIPSAKPQ